MNCRFFLQFVTIKLLTRLTILIESHRNSFSSENVGIFWVCFARNTARFFSPINRLYRGAKSNNLPASGIISALGWFLFFRIIASIFDWKHSASIRLCSGTPIKDSSSSFRVSDTRLTNNSANCWSDPSSFPDKLSSLIQYDAKWLIWSFSLKFSKLKAYLDNWNFKSSNMWGRVSRSTNSWADFSLVMALNNGIIFSWHVSLISSNRSHQLRKQFDWFIDFFFLFDFCLSPIGYAK